MKIPCKNCLCKAICHHKSYTKLMEDCSIIRRIVSKAVKERMGKDLFTDKYKKRYWKLLIEISKQINPYKWSVEHSKQNSSFVLKHILTAKNPPYILNSKQPFYLPKGNKK